MKVKSFIFLICFLSVCQNLWSKENVLTFSEAMHKASGQNWDIRIADERVFKSLNAVGEARSVLFPQISASASQFRQTRDLSGSGINIPGPTFVGPFNSFDARLKLTQTLFDVGMFERLQALHAQSDEAKSFSKKNKEDIIALCAGLFIEAYRAQENVKAQKSIFKLHKKQFQIASRQLSIGMITSGDWRFVKSQFSSAVHALVQAIAFKNQKFSDLNVVLNFSSQHSLVLVLDKNIQVNALGSIIDDNHPNIALARLTMEKSKRLKAMEQAQYLPRIEFVSNWGPSGIDPNHFSETYALGVQASVPVFESGARQARIKQAQSEVKINELNLKKISAQTQADVTKAKEAIRAAVAQMRNSDDVEQWAWQQLKEAVTSQGVGTVSPVVFLEKQAQWVTADDQKSEAVAGYLLAQINYAHALGRLSDLVLMNKGDGHREKK